MGQKWIETLFHIAFMESSMSKKKLSAEEAVSTWHEPVIGEV